MNQPEIEYDETIYDEGKYGRVELDRFNSKGIMDKNGFISCFNSIRKRNYEIYSGSVKITSEDLTNFLVAHITNDRRGLFGKDIIDTTLVDSMAVLTEGGKEGVLEAINNCPKARVWSSKKVNLAIQRMSPTQHTR